MVNGLSTIKNSLRHPLIFWQSSLGPSKELRELSSCQEPHIHSLSTNSHQCINKIYIVWIPLVSDNLPWFIMIFGVSLRLNPFIFLLGASAKFRCSRKPSYPHYSAGKWKQWFYLQNYHNTTSPILHFAFFQTEQKKCHLACHNHLYLCIPTASINHKLSFGSAMHMILPQNLM